MSLARIGRASGGRPWRRFRVVVLAIVAMAGLALGYEHSIRERGAAMRSALGWSKPQGNAYEHALASAELTVFISEGFAEGVGTLREGLQWLNLFNPGRASAIYKDLHNNAVGRRIGKHAAAKGLSGAAWRELLVAAVEDGLLIVIDADPRIPAGFDGNPARFNAADAPWTPRAEGGD